MSQVTEDILEEITEAIIQEIDPERIYLFGSRSRGDARPESDIDLLIVEEASFGPKSSRWQEIQRIRKVLPPSAPATDILLYSADEVEKWRYSVNHIIARCLREGKLLHARS